MRSRASPSHGTSTRSPERTQRPKRLGHRPTSTLHVRSARLDELAAPTRSIPLMRLLLVSDLHYSLKQLDWVTAAAADYDLLVVAGDLLDIRSYVEADAQIVVVLQYLARMAARTTVVACSGNHDLNARNAVGERAAVWLD